MNVLSATPSKPVRLLVVVAALVIVLWGISAARPIVVQFLLAVFLAILCGPPIHWLQKKGVPKLLSLLLIVVALVCVGLVVGGLVRSSVADFVGEWQAKEAAGDAAGDKPAGLPQPRPKEAPPERFEDDAAGDDRPDLVVEIDLGEPAAVREGQPAKEDQRARELGNKLQPMFEKVVNAGNALGLDLQAEDLNALLNPGVALRLTGSIFSQLSGLLTNAFLIILTVVFILFEASSFPEKLRASSRNAPELLARTEEFLTKVNRYIAIKTWLSLLTGVALGLWLTVIGVDYAILWGLLAFLLNYVPSLGSILASIPPVLVALIQSPEEATLVSAGWPLALAALVGCLTVNIIIGNILEPRFMGRGLDLSALVVFLSMVLWGSLLGPVGMVLSVPLTMTVKIALELDSETQGLAVWLGSESSAKKAVLS